MGKDGGAIIKRIISDIDSPTFEQVHQAFRKIKATDKKFHRGLYLPSFIKPCEGCGKETFDDGKVYYGQLFCGDCVDKWTNNQKGEK